MPITTGDYAILSEDVYTRTEPTDDGQISGTPSGVNYRVLEVYDDSSGYFGAIYQNVATGELIAVHRGTQFDDDFLRDLIEADGQMALSRINQQLYGAEYLVPENGVRVPFRRERGQSAFPPHIRPIASTLEGTLTPFLPELRQQTLDGLRQAGNPREG